MALAEKIGAQKVQTMIKEVFGLSRAAAIAGGSLVVAVVLGAIFLFVYLAPPTTIIMSSGPKGSTFERNAEKYAQILQRSGVTMKIVPSEGSVDNLKRLLDPSFKVDIAFVQGGVVKDAKIDKLMSLGSVFYQPLYVFYRNAGYEDVLSQLKGKRIAIGEVGSGTHTLSMELLKLNGIEPGGPTRILELDSDTAAQAMLDGKLDAAFLMGDSVSTDLIRKLRLAPGVKLFNFTQADGYTRKVKYLNKLTLPKGVIDFGLNLPPQDVSLIGPSVEIIARQNLHPALSDLLVEAAVEVHNRATVLQKRGEFPAPVEHEYKISEDAQRFYKSGKGFLYRYLPYSLASLVNRIILVLVPMIIVLLPGLRLIPAIYKWRIKSRITKWYKALMLIEQDLLVPMTPDKKLELIEKIDKIEDAVNRMKMPAAYADMFYGLRGHVNFVRARLTEVRH
jgi:TRAP-type uncharacterized transport system substrate-binding protein